MFEIRCPKCKNLLAKEEIRDGKVEIKCPHCNNYVTVDRLIELKYPLDKGVVNGNNKCS